MRRSFFATLLTVLISNFFFSGAIARDTSERGLDLIASFEGLELEAYRDVAGVWTIGYGHVSAAGPPEVVPGMVITEEEARAILRRDLAAYEEAVDGAVDVEITQNMFDALVSLSYNIGARPFRNSVAVKRLNQSDYEGAAEAMRWWNKADGRVLMGLTRRREAEVALFLEGYTDGGAVQYAEVEENSPRRRSLSGASIAGGAGAVAAGSVIASSPEEGEVPPAGSFTGAKTALILLHTEYDGIPSLRSFGREGEVLEAHLRERGFARIQTVRNPGPSEIRAALSEFYGRLADDEAALIYVLGVGLEANGRSYLATRGYVPSTVVGSEQYRSLVSMDEMATALSFKTEIREEGDLPPRVLFLSTSWDLEFDRPYGVFTKRGIGPVDAPAGVLVASSARADRVRLPQGEDGVSDFMRALLEHWNTASVSLEKSVAVDDAVYTALGNGATDERLLDVTGMPPGN